ncbi:MAG: class I SAM-dependent methyltransferase [Lachnospiraceae bacterium]|nr:class I SAM-dependent methyltransferase [Lachnospiraceae bacterium]
MKLSLKQTIEMYNLMQERGTVLYGAGQEGMLALQVLEREGIRVHGIADQQVGKAIGNRRTISLEELCAHGQNEICIVTPMQKLPEVSAMLKEHYEIVIDNFMIHWMEYYFPKDGNEIEYTRCFPFNHYESPYCQYRELELFRQQNNLELLDLDLNTDVQLHFIPKLTAFANDYLSAQQKGDLRYKINNGWFGVGDAILLHSMIREYQPQRIFEIGSGFSTCVMLDTKEYWSNCSNVQITCIEPYPDRLFSNIKKDDNIDIKSLFVQKIDLSEFESLEENDILFIDSSHVTKTGGDIIYEYFNILPRLKSGVLIHIHDILYPFTYPERWILEGRAYNEAYVLRALLMNSSAYEIIYWNDMMSTNHISQLMEHGLRKDVLEGSSLWLRKK